MHLLSLLLALFLAPINLAGLPSAVQPDDSAPVMQNPGFECGDGYHDQDGIHGMVPNGWTAKVLSGDPFMVSTQMWAKYSCDPNDMSWEKLEGHDSNIFLATEAHYNEDFIAPPFDVALYQSVKVTKGAEYSLSAWMTSLCGGSSNPNDCPPGAYIAKMAGLDSTGGTDPLASTVQWREDRRPHIEARWVNLIQAATAGSASLTVFVRVNSPFQHHGNHAFADAVKLVRAPASAFTSVSRRGNSITVGWSGSLGPDIPVIPATNHKLSFEIQVRREGGNWQPWLSGREAGEAAFALSPACLGGTYQFRIRAWAIQPAGQPGAWPNHHFVGVWHESAKVTVDAVSGCGKRLYLPLSRK